MKRILIIDDDKVVRTSIRAVLESAGHTVVDVGDADRGIGLHKIQNFDLIIVDLVMPNKEGLETIQELKAEYPTLPIVAISGGGALVQKNFVQVSKHFGATATLEKPFGGDELLSALDEAWGVRQNGRERNPEAYGQANA